MESKMPHIRIIEPSEKSADLDNDNDNQKAKLRFAVPSAPTKGLGRRSRHVTFSSTPAVNRSRMNLGNPSHRMGPLGGRRKVILAPGHSAMDWERIKKNKNLRNIDPSEFPMRITKARLQQHHSRRDCWVSLNGKVFDITNYLDFHPGGRDLLVENAGKDATLIFQKYHPWVNYERILDACFIGFLV
ncbi:hypothetical protein BRETT_000724 [Brettanomyces bruxellensis]|uniref:Cytochrome b5 heme-binding domain-containing protein n=1 Tax=Dekkera bruxellensis TaxID=5007 RepID=A0A871R2M7_DEKBR|nr:uncharacterized protein BRETT_000724 [Brettanomyces bruxellensis]QOU21007.1 hypothetical protein BRETT_000724 [Brettanomyces bruxellensis]